MIVTFALQQDTGQPLASQRAKYTIESVRKHLPSAKIVHLTNETYPVLDGVDDFVRYPYEGDFVTFLFGAMIEAFKIGQPMLHIATDVLILDDVSNVFEQEFDVAACRYPMTTRTDGAYCGDVKFIKDITIIKQSLDIYNDNPDIQDGWEGGQTAFLMATQRTKLVVKDLDFDIYCATPESQQAKLEGAKIAHFRGRRKRWMIDYAKKHI